MDDNKTPEQYRSEIAMLNHEVYELQRQLDLKTDEQQKAITLDRNDPFGNPTEYPGYSGDYSDIVPQIKVPGCRLPVEPGRREKKALRKYYSIGGACLVFQWTTATVLSNLLMGIVVLVINHLNPGASIDAITGYSYGSSIVSAITMITYLVANTLFAWLGLKWAKIEPYSLVKTRNYTLAKAFQYCFIAVFIQYVASLFSDVFSDIIEKYGYSADTMDTTNMSQTSLGIIIYIMYGCIIAPITEEFFFRGMLLKVFSRANQRFAIVASAVFFGLAHGNLAQFMLAFILGIFLAHIDMKHNSIIPSIVVHVFLNTISDIFNYTYDDGNIPLSAAIDMIYVLMAVTGLVMLVDFIFKNKLPRTTPQQSRRGFAVAKTSFPFVIAFVVQLAYLILLILETKPK